MFRFFDTDKRTLPEEVLNNKKLIDKLMTAVGLNFRGIWSANGIYNKNDVVNYSNSLYVCKSENSIQGILPTNSSYYDLILTAPVGATGARGPAGPQGPEGDAGVGVTDIEVEPGSVSEEGATYNLYFTLSDGQRKFAGDFLTTRGPQGERGIQGIRGPAGPQGPIGPTGAPGADGAKGEPGPVGPTGAPGATGPQGEPGKDGTSFSIDQVRNTVEELPAASETYKGQAFAVGEVAPRLVYVCAQTQDGSYAWVNMGQITGPQGPMGPKGETGETGATGQTGETGAQGPTGPAGPQGEAGVGVSSMSVSTGEDVEGGRAYNLNYILTDGQEESAGQFIAPIGPKGEPGQSGATGPEGPAGAAGANAPTITGIDFTLYQQTEAGAYYTPKVKLSDGQSISGPTGSVLCPQGPQGATGPAGPSGEGGKLYRHDIFIQTTATITGWISATVYSSSNAPLDYYSLRTYAASKVWVNAYYINFSNNPYDSKTNGPAYLRGGTSLGATFTVYCEPGEKFADDPKNVGQAVKFIGRLDYTSTTITDTVTEV